MSEWAKKIAGVFINNETRRTEIQQPLSELLIELKSEQGIREASVELVSEFPLVWNVIINGKQAKISEEDVALAQRLYDEPYEKTFTDPKRDVNDVLKELLMNRFK
ncbi:hypothetical protein [Paenibacillus donghaensis]|uniref:Uncharacterized protein n=1 Tax=Paenibacillus donghaensis TaxID=414771 RepID=A0A2Z2KQ68_9BACL|nr:hypothetical protein [Paenibacillus donghaensis]ASA23512.1 hypothetical protein B9T62_23550 [Paenibacillus donghaensis]